MIRGRFGDTSRRPYIEGRLVIKRLKIIANISFNIDTAADSSVLFPNDGRRIQLDYSKLKGKEYIVGIGGIRNFFIEPALIVFTDPGRNLYTYELDIKIAPNDRDLMNLPSILGLDIIDKWKLNIDFAKKQLGIQIVSADHIIPIVDTP